MDAFLHLPESRRRRFCEEAQLRLGLPAVSIEKDFWVCWALRTLFSLPEWGPHLTFKGGTSLSKAWQLIERFSEDIDIVISRDFLGFGTGRSPEAAPSRKQQRQRLDDLKAACRESIHGRLKPALEAACRASLAAARPWTLVAATAAEDPDEQTLLFHYPSLLADAGGYVRPVVRIELGARSDTEPSESPAIRPYVYDAFGDVLGVGSFPVHAVAPQRTFWEKAMLLHEETFRPPDKPRKGRLARHYYDLWCLIRKGVARGAVEMPGLFERVAAHREVFFRWSWVDYSTLRRGSLRILPPAEQRGPWRQDYAAMRQEMFFGEVPDFEEILRVVGTFERDFNQTPAAGL